MAFGLPRKGTLRLQVLLALAAIAILVAVLGVALILNGPPYWRGWWVVIAGLALAAIPAGILVSRLIEWVIAGYLDQRSSGQMIDAAQGDTPPTLIR